ncbi:MAG: hypothetical protein KAU50_08020, partial [Candidatus Marinimicrobia bacterium]|nr:hypothetical protein [Candidatus Neomarinimicrobiota bacterium]
MKIKLIMFAFIACVMASISPVMGQSTVPVTFQVDLRIKTAEGVFIPGTDNVTLRGSFMSELGMSGDWFPDEGALVLADADADTIYTHTIDMPDTSVGTTFEFKYAINDAMWEGDPNRSFVLASTAQVLPVELFDRDDEVTINVVNTLNFTADLTGIYGTGIGYFDPDADSLLLMGLDWVGAVVQEGSQRKFVEDPFSPGIYHTTMIIKGVEGDSTKWKTKAYPDDHFFNWGWEITSDKWHTIVADGAAVDVPPFVPDVFPIKPALTADVPVLFQVDMTNAINRYTDDPIDPAGLIFVGLKGQNDVLGAWGGDYALSDTTEGTMLVLNDGGTSGDKMASDNIWSLLVTFPAGNSAGPSLYQYAAYYPEADTTNGGIRPLKNEFASGTDHWVNILEGVGTIDLINQFGVYGPSGATVPVTFQV